MRGSVVEATFCGLRQRRDLHNPWRETPAGRLGGPTEAPAFPW